VNGLLAPTFQVLPFTVIRRERKLPFPAKVLVRKGQKVGANDAVVEAKLSSKHLMLDIAVGLAVSRTQSERFIRVKPGDRLAKGDLIAGPAGIGKRVMRASQNCQVILVGSDRVLLELTDNLIQVKAGMSGEVVELISDCGVVIETTGALIQGTWGNGRVDFGVMSVQAKEPGGSLLSDQLDLSKRGAVILGAHCDSEDTLHLAQELPVRGLILASMLISLRSVAEKMDYPIILLEGFGSHSMSKPAFTLLSDSGRREVSVNAQAWNAFKGRRPEIVIPHPGERVVAPPRTVERLSVNQQVRSVRAPHAGEIGRLIRLCGTVSLPSGIRTQAAEVQYVNGEKAVLPLENLEVFI